MPVHVPMLVCTQRPGTLGVLGYYHFLPYSLRHSLSLSPELVQQLGSLSSPVSQPKPRAYQCVVRPAFMQGCWGFALTTFYPLSRLPSSMVSFQSEDSQAEHGMYTCSPSTWAAEAGLSKWRPA